MCSKIFLRYMVFLLACAPIFACKNDKDKQDKAAIEDSLVAAKSVKEDDSSKIFDNQAAINFVQNFSSKKLKWKRFQLMDYGIDLQEKSKSESFTPDKKFLTEYKSVLKYSPNKKHILDLNSDNLIPIKGKDGKMTLEGGDPETEISLIDPVNKKRTKLLFFGADSEIITGEWLSNEDIAIVGVFPTKTAKMDTLMHVINVKTFFTRTYKYKK